VKWLCALVDATFRHVAATLMRHSPEGLITAL
jgi:hypothetical protein